MSLLPPPPKQTTTQTNFSLNHFPGVNAGLYCSGLPSSWRNPARNIRKLYMTPPQLLDSRFPVSGTWIPDSLSWNSDSKVLGFGFHKRKIPDAVIRIRWGDMIQGRIYGEGAGGTKRTPCPFPQDDQHLSNTTGILQKKIFVVCWCWSQTWDDLEEFMLNSVKMVVS